AKDLLPEGFTSEHSPNGKFTKENDIMDVWFDSGSSHQGVCAERDYLTYPADLYLEGSDQYRGWFNSSLITSVAFSGKAPYKQLLSQGFTLDGEGHKMSKSLGNGIDPMDVIDKYGVDALRWFLATGNTAGQDVRFSYEKIEAAWNFINKLWNASRYVIMNLGDMEKPELPDSSEWNLADKWILSKLNSVVNQVTDHFEKYNFGEA
ncbi:class I tRNA ligase family protein, partial [Enterococcus lactis]|uniref:class I tRNA ligase family protein n=1 Tax=Enterococcus lactis TaxID=357441 RepID=UPI003907EF2B